MYQTGGIVPTQGGGALGIVLSTRDIAQGPNGSTLQAYRIRTIDENNGINAPTQPEGAAGAERRNPFASSAGLQAPEGTRGAARLVDPSTLTVAQAQEAGLSPSDLQRVVEANQAVPGEEEQDGSFAPNVEGTNATGGRLSADEQAEVTRLRARDQAVRQEETAHAAAAGAYGSAPQYETVTGPDGNQYAVGGHVDVSVNVSGSPEQVERALRTIQNAALAPNAPSSADLSAFRGAVADQGAVRANAAAEALQGAAEDQPRLFNPAELAAASDAYRRAAGAA